MYNDNGYHFLTAINRNNLCELGYFDSDYSMGSCYDDDDFIYRVKNVLKLKVINVICDTSRLLGLHLHHKTNTLHHSIFHIELNKYILDIKKKYFNKYGIWLHLSEISNKKKLMDIIIECFVDV